MKQELESLLKEVDAIREKHEVFLKKNRFNFFTAMHKERAEVQLHSRFISYLLSPTSGHGQNDNYLKFFVRDILNISEAEFDLDKCLVIPNEHQKKEFENIDILIINKRRKQAIIIENKIDAGDSNKIIAERQNGEDDKSDYAGQLSRYYKTIKTGRNFRGNELKGFQCDHVFIYYLSIDGRPPSPESLGKLLPNNPEWKGTLAYGSHIIPWLEKCIEQTTESQFSLREFIQHYLNLIKKMTHNDISIDERIALKELVSTKLNSTKFLIENFKHVKWHAVDDFWIKLAERMSSEGFDHVHIYPEHDFVGVISKITHSNENLNHGIHFSYRGTNGYISGENNLSWGIHEPKKYRIEFDNELLNDINFSSFSSENTFKLINAQNRDQIISALIDDITNEEKVGYQYLESEQ